MIRFDLNPITATLDFGDRTVTVLSSPAPGTDYACRQASQLALGIAGALKTKYFAVEVQSPLRKSARFPVVASPAGSMAQAPGFLVAFTVAEMAIEAGGSASILSSEGTAALRLEYASQDPVRSEDAEETGDASAPSSDAMETTILRKEF